MNIKSSVLDFNKKTSTFFKNKKHPIQFDFVILGIGDDGHTASLFPDDASLNTEGEISTFTKTKHNIL